MPGLAYAYYPGCSLHGTAKEYDISARLVCQALGVELRELEDWTCCGASSAHSLDHLLAVALPAHELKGAQKMGLPLAVACAMCFSRLKFAQKELKDSATLAQVNEILGAKLDNKVAVEHLLSILGKVSDISVKKPLRGLKVACYYGCLLARPKDVIDSSDNDENPQSMDRLLSRVGAECVPWGFKTECCGASFPFAHLDIVLKLSGRILSQAKQAGADCLAVACPMCHSNLDAHQRDMKSSQGAKVEMPIIYFTQLLGLALGFSAQQLHLDKHFADPLPLLREKSLI